MPMVEEFELLEEAEVQFEDSDCADSVWHGVGWKSHATLTLLAMQDCPLWLQYD